MSITLGTHALPDGLLWSDETDWAAVDQEVVYVPAVGGRKPVVAETPNTAGRPITLSGGARWAWMTRTDLLALIAAMAVPGVTFTLTLHDARTFTVAPRRAGADSAVDAHPLPAVMDSGPADPAGTTKYVVDAIRLITV